MLSEYYSLFNIFGEKQKQIEHTFSHAFDAHNTSLSSFLFEYLSFGN